MTASYSRRMLFPLLWVQGGCASLQLWGPDSDPGVLDSKAHVLSLAPQLHSKGGSAFKPGPQIKKPPPPLSRLLEGAL